MVRVTLEVLRTGDLILHSGDLSEYFGTDWNRPFVASMFGWMTKHERLGRGGFEECPGWRSTDGTIACTVCGMTAGEFIASATEYLESHDGETADVDASYVTLS